LRPTAIPFPAACDRGTMAPLDAGLDRVPPETGREDQEIKIPAKTLVKNSRCQGRKGRGFGGKKVVKELYPGKPKHFVLLDRLTPEINGTKGSSDNANS
jgi:hypothetical protein